jgi:hypothetical protein
MTKIRKRRSIVMHSSNPYRCRIPTHEALDAMKDLTSGAFKLLIYYYSKSTGWEFVDDEIANALGVTTKRLKELKKELTDKDYLLVAKGADIDNYFIGRQAVRNWKDPAENTEGEEDARILDK